jgi:diguanylate cyclase (GGDEF)-like protein
VEDDPEQAAYVKAILESAGHTVFICSDPAEFDAMLRQHAPDLVLMDILLPGVTGYDLVRYLRQDERNATLPVLFLTTEGQLQSRYHTARVGGDDHLVKPVVAPLLLSTVAARIERSRFVRQLLSRDGLTRLLTHTAFIEAAQGLHVRQQEGHVGPVAWVMIDVDHFKSVNDRFGHPVGDRVLASLAALLRRKFRQSDRVGRYGGEEFATLIEELPEAEVVRLVERLLAEFGAMEHHAADGQPFHTTFSAGVAMLKPGMTLDAWKKASDDALYAAKSAGRNRVMAFGGASAPRTGEHGTQGSALGTR